MGDKPKDDNTGTVCYDAADDVVFVLKREGVWVSMPSIAECDNLEDFMGLQRHHHYGLLLHRLFEDPESFEIMCVLCNLFLEHKIDAEAVLRAKEMLEQMMESEETETVVCDWLKVTE